MSRRSALIVALAIAALSIILALWLRSGSKANETRSREADTSSASTLQDLPSPAPIASSIHDRKARDQVRERIYKARGEAPPETGGTKRSAGTTAERERSTAPNAASPMGAPDKGPGLDPQYIRSVVREDFWPMAKQCYESALAGNPKLAGKLVVFFTIVGDEKVGGIVESAEISDGTTIEDEKLRQCFTESMMTLAFKPPPKGGKVTVKYPFSMEPDDPPDGGK